MRKKSKKKIQKRREKKRKGIGEEVLYYVSLIILNIPCAGDSLFSEDFHLKRIHKSQ